MTKKRQSFSARRQVKLEVIPEPKEGTASVIVPSAEMKDPIMKGDGPVNCVCGACGFLILEGIASGQVRDIVFKCAGCGVFNRINAPGTV